MSEANKQLARRWFEEVWNKQRREAIAEMLHPDAIVHDGTSVSRGPNGFYSFYDRMHAAFSNIHITLHDAIAEGNKVCVLWSCTMEHTGSGFGMAPTGKQIETTGITIVRVVDGKLVEGWQNWDMLGVMQKIKEESAAPTYIV